MSPSNKNGSAGSGEDQPIDRLAELEQEVSPDFLRAVRKKIYRRTATGQVLAFSWNLPKVILLEMLTLIGGLVACKTSKVKP